MLENLSGNFRIDKVSLTLDTAGGALMHPAPGQDAVAGRDQRRHSEHGTQFRVQVTGNSSGSVPAYLALVANSPLGKLLDGALDEAQGTGDWRMPIKLTVPLLNTDDTQVDGHIQFADNSFSFMPEMPLLTQMHGDLEFSEKGVQTREVRAQFLGGPVKISGRLAQSGDALNFEGTLAGAGLTQISNAASMSRFSGKAAYKGKLSYQKGGAVEISGESDLAGMAIDMPAPVGKSAQSSQLLKLQWARAGPGQPWPALADGQPGHDGQRAVRARSRQQVGVVFRARRGRHQSPGQPADRSGAEPERQPAGTGHGRLGKGRRRFFRPARQGASRRPPILPPPGRVSLATGVLRTSGYTLNDLTLYATRPDPAQWRVDIQSRQAAGSLEWREASGAIAGQITARLKHLALGGEDDGNKADEALSSNSDLSDIPAIDLQAKQFLLYGKPGRIGCWAPTWSAAAAGGWTSCPSPMTPPSSTPRATGRWTEPAAA